MTDADTIANAEELWQLVRRVQDTIDKDGSSLFADEKSALKRLRQLADEIDPEYGRF